MNRSVVTAGWLFGLAGLAGCPIYDHEDAGCFRDGDCASNYVCDQPSGACVFATNSGCTKPSDCNATATCTEAGVCVFGDCTFNGCVAGYHCDSSSGIWTCVSGASGGSGGSSQAGEAGSSSAGAAAQSAGGASGAAGASTGGVAGG